MVAFSWKEGGMRADWRVFLFIGGPSKMKRLLKLRNELEWPNCQEGNDSDGGSLVGRRERESLVDLRGNQRIWRNFSFTQTKREIKWLIGLPWMRERKSHREFIYFWGGDSIGAFKTSRNDPVPNYHEPTSHSHHLFMAPFQGGENPKKIPRNSWFWMRLKRQKETKWSFFVFSWNFPLQPKLLHFGWESKGEMKNESFRALNFEKIGRAQRQKELHILNQFLFNLKLPLLAKQTSWSQSKQK